MSEAVDFVTPESLSPLLPEPLCVAVPLEPRPSGMTVLLIAQIPSLDDGETFGAQVLVPALREYAEKVARGEAGREGRERIVCSNGLEIATFAVSMAVADIPRVELRHSALRADARGEG